MDQNVLIAIIAATVTIGGSIMTAGVALAGSWFITRGDRERIAVLETSNAALWEARRTDALTLRAQGDHIDTLEQWIYEGKAPPPPPRPNGV